ncbi:hypothetical protein LRP49_14510 [Enterovibrio sp. ZSDZ35]|uniref:Uncharacterized protein n=1 Tax=Enterovibrio qingdaonensis TaxID=2899818 RepID=A0ABT5QN11_9GAMM|nr:hypothetical protein [Enterovibrio sp. ZSDZ35]MDD1782381.1 hypothetical protein [Enterovibrio sp. ZSDZ35]
MKVSYVSAVLLLFSLLLLIFSQLTLQNALTSKAMVSRITHFSEHANLDIRQNDQHLGASELATVVVTAHQLNSASMFNQWLSYLGHDARTNDYSSSLLLTSSYLRPTWANTYVELAKLAESPKDAEAFRSLASLFGPYSLSSRLMLVDSAFSNWESMQVENRVYASQHLVSLASSWRHRNALNTMITYSGGKQRICNLLAFNKVKVQACV